MSAPEVSHSLLTVTSFANELRSLQHSLGRRDTQNKQRAQELLDLELQSVASKEYDPSNISLRGSRFRSSHQVPSKG